MARRNSYMPPISEPRPIHLPNPPHTNPQRHFGSAVVMPEENRLFNTGVHCPNYHSSNSGALHEGHQHSQPTALTSQSHQYLAQYGQRSYRNESSGNTISPHAESGRMTFKRKHTQPTFENTRGYCCPASSSTVTVPLNNIQHNPIPASLWAQASTDNSLPAGEHFQRSVRCRYGPSADNPARQSSLNHLPFQICPSSENNYASSIVVEQCRPPLHGYSSCATTSHSNAAAIGGSGLEFSTNPVPLLPSSHVSVTHRTLASSSRFFNGRRTTYNRIYPCNNTQPGISAPASHYAGSSAARSGVVPRYPRPPTWNGEASSSNMVGPLSNELNARPRWTTQSSTSMDVLSMFDPFDFSDEHRDLRVDIDNMTYEELLALEERIGNVSTGLSEHHISLCLSQTIYCSSDPAQKCREENSCPICLEEYEEEENLGILKCRHVFHVLCIKNWLSIKNACPICKAPAVDDNLKKKGKATS